MRAAEHQPHAGAPRDTRIGADPALPLSRGLLRIAGATLGIGVVLALLPPLLDLRSTDCGPASCLLVQTIGKVLACAAVILAMSLLIARSIRARQIGPAVLAATILVPAVIWAISAVRIWQDATNGTAEVNVLVGTARAFAAARTSRPPEELRGLAVDGKLGWALVKVTDREARSQFVILRQVNGAWTPQAIAPTFSRDELRAMGAPSDLMRDAR